MSTTLRSTPSRVKRHAFPKCSPRAYFPWLTPISDRQQNAVFESQIMPALSSRLEHAFADLPDADREDAVQDTVCQALEAYRALHLGESASHAADVGGLCAALAVYVVGRYQAGIRFASHQ